MLNIKYKKPNEPIYTSWGSNDNYFINSKFEDMDCFHLPEIFGMEFKEFKKWAENNFNANFYFHQGTDDYSMYFDTYPEVERFKEFLEGYSTQFYDQYNGNRGYNRDKNKSLFKEYWDGWQIIQKLMPREEQDEVEWRR